MRQKWKPFINNLSQCHSAPPLPCYSSLPSKFCSDPHEILAHAEAGNGMSEAVYDNSRAPGSFDPSFQKKNPLAKWGHRTIWILSKHSDLFPFCKLLRDFGFFLILPSNQLETALPLTLRALVVLDVLCKANLMRFNPELEALMA